MYDKALQKLTALEEAIDTYTPAEANRKGTHRLANRLLTAVNHGRALLGDCPEDQLAELKGRLEGAMTSAADILPDLAPHMEQLYAEYSDTDQLTVIREGYVSYKARMAEVQSAKQD